MTSNHVTSYVYFNNTRILHGHDSLFSKTKLGKKINALYELREDKDYFQEHNVKYSV